MIPASPALSSTQPPLLRPGRRLLSALAVLLALLALLPLAGLIGAGV